MACKFNLLALLLLALLQPTWIMGFPKCGPVVAGDEDKIEFAQNLEFLEAEFFLYGALGQGLDTIGSKLAKGGPLPIGARKANLDPLTYQIILEFGYQEVGHLRAIEANVVEIRRPLLDLSPQDFAKIFDLAVGYSLNPPFDPYLNSINYLLAAYVIPYEGLVVSVGTIPSLQKITSLSLVASLLGVEAGQDAAIRTLLYKIANQTVLPYNITVAYFADKISQVRNQLSICGIKDKGLIVPLDLGAENRTNTNALSANAYSVSYSRTPPEILRALYGIGNESVPGGFLPQGENGNIARSYLP